MCGYYRIGVSSVGRSQVTFCVVLCQKYGFPPEGSVVVAQPGGSGSSGAVGSLLPPSSGPDEFKGSSAVWVTKAACWGGAAGHQK